MDLSPEMELKRAVEKYFRDTRAHRGILTSWVLVSHMYNALDEGASSNYTLVPGSDDQPEHVTLGLLEAGNRLVRSAVIQ